MAARQSWSAIKARAPGCQPHAIQSALLTRNSQNPARRRPGCAMPHTTPPPRSLTWPATAASREKSLEILPSFPRLNQLRELRSAPNDYCNVSGSWKVPGEGASPDRARSAAGRAGRLASSLRLTRVLQSRGTQRACDAVLIFQGKAWTVPRGPEDSACMSRGAH